MSFLNLWDGIKKKTCRFFLQRYLGQFLEEKLNLEQLNVDLYNGKATLKNVSLKVDALNEIFEAQGWAVEVITGHLGVLTVSVPWNALMTNDSLIEVSNVFVTLRPIRRQTDGTSMLESMWSSVSSSMQLAEECMKLNYSIDGPMEEANSTSIIGLEKFAETIDTVLNRIRAKFTNIKVRLDLPLNMDKGIALIVNIDELCYRNETGSDSSLSKETEEFSNEQKGKQQKSKAEATTMHYLPTFAKHNIAFNGLQVSTDQYTTRSGQKNVADSCNDGITILTIRDMQNIHIKMKQSEEINGPKIDLHAEIGFVYTFLTPRQVHILVKFWEAFFGSNSIQNSKQQQRHHQIFDKIDTNEDMTKSYMTGVLGREGNWMNSTDEQPIHHQTTIPEFSSAYDKSYTDDIESCCYNSMQSSISSNCTLESAGRLQRRNCSSSVYGDILNFNVRITSIVAAILHENVIVETASNTDTECSSSSNNSIIVENSEMDLNELAKKFFNTKFTEQQIETKQIIPKNHLFVRMIPIMISGKQKRHKNMLSLVCTLNTTRFDLHEINGGETTSLISFDRLKSLSDGYPKRPELIVNINSTTNTSTNTYATDINVSLENCTIEVDVTIIDRLSYVFGPSPYKTQSGDTPRKVKSESNDGFKITSNTIGVKLRFPIYDARPLDDPAKVPWWKKNVRTDFLYFVMNEFNFDIAGKTIKIAAKEMDAYFCEKDITTKIHVLRAYERPLQSKSKITNNSIEVIINIPAIEDLRMPCDAMASNEHSKLPFSSERICRQSDTTHNKRHSTESDYILLPGEAKEIKDFFDNTMKASKLQIYVNFACTDLNFDSKHLYELIYNRLNSDLFMWEPHSPIYTQPIQKVQSSMQQNFLSGSLIESVYIPSIPSTIGLFDDLSIHNPKTKAKTNEVTFSIYDDVNKNMQGHRSLEGFNNSDSIYFSTHQESESESEISTTTIAPSQYPNQKPCECTVEINIGEGSLTVLVPVRDAENRVLPNQMGEFIIKVEKLLIYCTNGCKNNENLGYVCVQSHDVKVYHCGLVPGEYFDGFSRKVDIPDFMKAILYKVPADLTKGTYVPNTKREQLSVVIETRKIPEQRIKRIKITTGIQRIALRHIASHNSFNWLTQLIDFLDVTDYPIEGYCPYGIVNEIQIHLWDCAIDYRPIKLPYRTVIEIGSFTLSKNMISSTSGDNSRFIAEDCILSIAPFVIKDSKTKYLDSEITSIPSKNLIPVLDIGLFDISLRLSEKMVEKCPKFDLRCSIHDVHLRTCYDSGSAFAQLITHLASDGDLNAENLNNEENSTLFNSVSECSDIMGAVKPDDAAMVTETQQQRVQLMMADAVKEIVLQSENLCKLDGSVEQSIERGVDVYYFPDESSKLVDEANTVLDDIEKRNELLDILNFETNLMMASCCTPANTDEHYQQEALPQVKSDLGDVRNTAPTTKSGKPVHPEDDYCIIANEEKSFLHQFGIQDLKVSGEPLRIVDNHFTMPNQKADLLKPPDDFPMPIQRYTLCELTFTWHLYGGTDFPSTTTIPINSDHDQNKEKIPMSEAYKHGVSYSKCANEIQFAKKKKEKMTWKTKGGPARNHEVLVEIQFSKLQLSHENYPNHTWQASRQVLLIHDIEIRDRLQSSEINKFLHHPHKTSLSNKSSYNMLVIKALHVRPNPQKSAVQECSLRISLLPMRLHIDQNTLEFLADFFTNLSNNCTPEKNATSDGANPNSSSMPDSTKSTTHDLAPPVMNVIDDDEIPEAVHDLQARKLITTNLDLLMENDNNDEHASKTGEDLNLLESQTQSTNDTQPIYFREVTFSPDVPICIDYHGRRIELSRGPIVGLLMGLGQLECSEIRLKKLVCRGLLGMDKLVNYLCKQWLEDIKRNQLPKILSGVGPTNALVQLFKGIYDLFWLPIEQYQKDGRIIKGLQLGAQSFTARTALAALELTSRIIYLLQFTAETAFDIVSPGPSMRDIQKGRRGKKKRPVRPKDIREGVSNAYFIVKEGINDSANTIIETAIAEHDQKGYTGAVGAVMRQIPQLVVCPAVLATQATTNILGGVKNSLVPEAKIEAHEKWKSEKE